MTEPEPTYGELIVAAAPFLAGLPDLPGASDAQVDQGGVVVPEPLAGDELHVRAAAYRAGLPELEAPEPVAPELPAYYDDEVLTARAAPFLAGLPALRRHLPGKHDQSSHGHGGGGGGRSELNDLFARAESGGFTYSPATHEFAATGYAVSPYPERSKVVPMSELTPQTIGQYRKDNADLLAKPGHQLGAWREKDGDVDQVWLDVSIVAKDRAEGARIGREFDQVSMFDLGTGTTIDLGGTGGQARANAAGGRVGIWRGGVSPIRGPTLHSSDLGRH